MVYFFLISASGLTSDAMPHVLVFFDAILIVSAQIMN